MSNNLYQRDPWHDAAEDYLHAVYERHPVEDLEPIADTDLAELGRLLGGLWVWTTERPAAHRGRPWRATVGARTLILIYSVRPDLLGFRNHQELARACGLSDRQVERLRAEIRSMATKRDAVTPPPLRKLSVCRTKQRPKKGTPFLRWVEK